MKAKEKIQNLLDEIKPFLPIPSALIRYWPLKNWKKGSLHALGVFFLSPCGGPPFYLYPQQPKERLMKDNFRSEGWQGLV
jgi:hypothetical protein